MRKMSRNNTESVKKKNNWQKSLTLKFVPNVNYCHDLKHLQQTHVFLTAKCLANSQFQFYNGGFRRFVQGSYKKFQLPAKFCSSGTPAAAEGLYMGC